MSQPQPELPSIVESADDGDRPSITEVNGSVARFEMAYNPDERDRFPFGPPLSQRLGSLVFLVFALAILVTVLVAYNSTGHSALYVWVVEGDKSRPFGSIPLAFFILLSAIGTVVRAGMRGVIVTNEGIEARYLLAMGVPRIRKWSWAQVDRLVIDDEAVMLELWNGTYERLPPVREGRKLADLLARVATAHARQVTRLNDRR